jgi:hypothetical protein
MATRDFSSLAVRLQPVVPGCPRQTIVQYIRDAAIKTCERTLTWRYQVPRFDLTAGTYIYSYRQPFDSQVHAVFSVLLNNIPLEVLTLDRALELYPAWADKYTTSGDIALYGSQPRSVTEVSPDAFAVLPLPDAERTYNVRMFVALKPTRTASGMDEVIFNDLEDVMMHGALQHLLALPKTNWSDRELATYHAKQYLTQLVERRARANLGNARGTFAVQMQPFGV